MSQNLNYVFLDPMTTQCMNLIIYHDLVMIVAVGVMSLVVWFLMIFWYKKWFFGNVSNYKFQKNNILEGFWTFVPMVILVGLGYESLMNLCAGEVGDDLDYKVKITAHQWYWSYEYMAGGRNKSTPLEVKKEKNMSLSGYKKEVAEGSIGFIKNFGVSDGVLHGDPSSPEHILFRCGMACRDAQVLAKEGFAFFESFNFKFLNHGYYDDKIYSNTEDFSKKEKTPKPFMWEDSMPECGVSKSVGFSQFSGFINGPLNWKIYPYHIKFLVDEAMKDGYDYSKSVSFDGCDPCFPGRNALIGDHISFWLASVCRCYAGGYEGDNFQRVPCWDSYLTMMEAANAGFNMYSDMDNSWVSKLEYEVLSTILNKNSLVNKLTSSEADLVEDIKSFWVNSQPEVFFRDIKIPKGFWKFTSNSPFSKEAEIFSSYGSGKVGLENLGMALKELVNTSGGSMYGSYSFLDVFEEISKADNYKPVSLSESSAMVVEDHLFEGVSLESKIPGDLFGEYFFDPKMSVPGQGEGKGAGNYESGKNSYIPQKTTRDVGVFEYKADHYGVTRTLFSHLLSLGDDLLSWDVDGFGLDYLLSEFSRDGCTTDWLYLPVGNNTEISVTSADVIHSWGVPSFGLKVDAIPGRLNRVMVKPLYVGVAFGNCYELCGYGHSVMPINVMVVPESYYVNYLHKDLIPDLLTK